jgi:hypothetical protein
MRSLILDSQITISSLGSCTPLHMKGVSHLNKWARDLEWMSRGCIYIPLNQSQPLCANSAFFVLLRHAGRRDWTRPVSGNGRFWNQGRWVTRRANESDQGWPDVSGRSKPSLETLCFFFTIDRTHWSRIRSVAHRVRSLTLAVLTADSATCASGHELTSVRSDKQFVAAVQYTDRTRPVKKRTASGQAKRSQTTPDCDATWTKLVLNDLWASPELPSAKFDKCAPHLNN